MKQECWEQQWNSENYWVLAILIEKCLQLWPNQGKPAHIPLVVTYHPILPTFQSVIKCHPSTLHILEWLREAFTLPPLTAFHRLKNLRNFLVWATLTVNNQAPPDNPPCRAAGWKTCPILMALDEFTSHTTGLVYKMKFSASCNSSNIIRLITCRRCSQ